MSVRNPLATVGARLALVVVMVLLIAVLAARAYSAPRARAVFVVNSSADAVDANPGDGVCATATGECTLRAAIHETNLLPGPDTIEVPAGTYLLTIPGAGDNNNLSGDLDITGELVLTGAGAGRTIIDAGGADRVLHITCEDDPYLAPEQACPRRIVTLSGLTLRNGNAADGAGILNYRGRVSLKDSEIINGSGSRGVAVFSDGGPFVTDGASVGLRRVVISGNSGSNIVYLFNGTISTIVNSTVSDNAGSGIVSRIGAQTFIVYATVAGNSGVGIDGGFPGTTVKNTIVANNGTGGCLATIITDGYPNLDDDGTCGFTLTGDPLLGALADNGGPTRTQAIGELSPARNSGDCAASFPIPTVDARGAFRPQGSSCDIGAFEYGENAGDLLTVSAGAEGLAGTLNVGPGELVSYHTGTGVWARVLDVAAYGVADADVDAYLRYSPNRYVLSFAEPTTVPGVGLVDDSDLVLLNTNGGTFLLAFDGSDVGLDTDDEDVDAIAAVDGLLVVSTTGPFSVPGLTGEDEDLIRLDNAVFGPATSGTWALYFDGSDVGLGNDANRDINGAWYDGNTGRLYLTALGTFTLVGQTFDGSDVGVCVLTGSGSTTSCGAGSGLFWDGSAALFSAGMVDALDIALGAAPVAPVIRGMEVFGR